METLSSISPHRRSTLHEYADEHLQHTKEWPKAANVLSGALKRLAPLFREAGQIQIKQLSRSDRQGTKRWSVRAKARGVERWE